VSVLGIIEQQESGGQNILTAIPAAPGAGANTASGYYQIINGTWQKYAPQAGINVAQYPTAMSDPSLADQTAVASLIPLNQWAPSTVAAVQAQYPGVNTSLPVGQLDQQVSGSTAATGGATAATPGAGTSTGSASSGTLGNWTLGLWSVLERSLIVIVGLILLMTALGAMFLKSAFEEVSVHDLAKFGEVA
jgi:hypothetical protein